MKAAPFAYERPSDLNAAISLMADVKEEKKVIAGGQSLGPMLNLRLVQPELVIDISGIAELKQHQSRIGEIPNNVDWEAGRPNFRAYADTREFATYSYEQISFDFADAIKTATQKRALVGLRAGSFLTGTWCNEAANQTPFHRRSSLRA